jgi:hypothetical protein
MKHLKAYKIFESNAEDFEEYVQTLNDILTELEDFGYETSVTLSPLQLALRDYHDGEVDTIIVTIQKYSSRNKDSNWTDVRNDKFNKIDLQMTYNRMVEYMSSNGFVKEIDGGGSKLDFMNDRYVMFLPFRLQIRFVKK